MQRLGLRDCGFFSFLNFPRGDDENFYFSTRGVDWFFNRFIVIRFVENWR